MTHYNLREALMLAKKLPPKEHFRYVATCVNIAVKPRTTIITATDGAYRVVRFFVNRESDTTFEVNVPVGILVNMNKTNTIIQSGDRVTINGVECNTIPELYIDVERYIPFDFNSNVPMNRLETLQDIATSDEYEYKLSECVMDRSFVQTALKSLKDDEVTIKTNHKNGPVVIKGVNAFWLIMPIRS